ncbi:WD repeat-containing protein 25-like [Liolophura sinensis]|uniref:WD repeat-containing protein 25-like n=1 Tax=Liolophura sinensis TaxID=3198878 RepID=UPI003158002F
MQALLGYGGGDSSDSQSSEKSWSEETQLHPYADLLPSTDGVFLVSSANTFQSNNNTTSYSSNSNFESSIDTSPKPPSNQRKSETNFFGLLSCDSDDDATDGPRNKHRKTESENTENMENKVSIDGVEINLPDSEFWINTAADLQSKADNGSPAVSGGMAGALCQEIRDTQCFIKSSEQYITANDYDRCHFSTEYHHSNAYEFSAEYKPTQNNIQNYSDKPTIPVERRKIYYVHSKVAPHLQSYRSRECKPPKGVQVSLPGHQGVVNKVKWCCPNYSHLLLSASMDTHVKIWNCWSRVDPCVQTISQHNKAVKDAEWNSDGKKVLSCSFDRTAAVSDVETGQLERRFTAPGFVTCGKFHPVYRDLILAGSNNCVLCWDLRQASGPVKTFTHKDRFGQVQDVIVSRDGSQVFGSCDLVSKDSADRNILAWDFNSTVVLSNQIFQERYVCTRLKQHPTEDTFLAQTHGNYIAVFSINRPYKLDKYRRFEGHKMLGYSVGFDVSPDGSLVCSGSGEGRFHFYHYQSGKMIRTIDTGWNICMDVAYHPVLYSAVAGASWTGELGVWL